MTPITPVVPGFDLDITTFAKNNKKTYVKISAVDSEVDEGE